MVGAMVHRVLDTDIRGPFPNNLSQVFVGMGCFWGAEKLFWGIGGIYTTSVGYAGGHAKEPTYQSVCSGETGHAEVVRIVYDSTVVSLDELLQQFWEHHDPTQGMRQGADIGSQYRSIVLCQSKDDLECVGKSLDMYQGLLNVGGFGIITTEICILNEFYYAEEYHQQYLSKNPDGYCGLRGTGIKCIL